MAGFGMEIVYQSAAKLHLIPANQSPWLTRDKVTNVCSHRDFSIQKAARELGYQPRVDFAAGLAFTIDWMKARGIL